MKRWFKYFAIAFAIALAVIFGIIRWVDAGDPRSIERADGVHVLLFPILNVLMLAGVVGGIILIITYAVKRGVQEANGPVNARGFPIAANNISANDIDGPGQ